jgi:hypothetical protein
MPQPKSVSDAQPTRPSRQPLVGSDLRVDRSSKAAIARRGRLGDATLPTLCALVSGRSKSLAD